MDYKKILPYLVAITLFVVVNVLYFAPQFRGETIFQNDVMQYKGMAQDILEHRAEYGEDPQWAGNMFGGMPAYMIAMRYDGMIIKTLSKAFSFLGDPAAMIFIAMTCFFLMLLCMGINPWLGIIPSLAYGFSTYFFVIIGAGHIAKMVTLAFIPLIFGGMYYTYRRNMWLGAALTGIAASIVIGANHPQIIYYFLFIFAAFWINEFFISYKSKTLDRFAKCTALLALAAALAAGSNAGMLWYANHHSAETTRGGTELIQSAETNETNTGLDIGYATAWSYGKGETFNLLIPDLYGGSTEGGFAPDGDVAKSLVKYNARDIATQLPAYWGPQPGTSGPVYIGAVIIFIAVLGLFLLRGRMKWWMVVVSVLAITLSWGKNMMWFTEIFFNHFPMYNKFRTVSMILVVVEWCVPLLAALTLQQLWTGGVERAKFMRGLKYTTIITGGIALFFLLFGKGLLSFTGAHDAQLPADVVAAMMSERAAMMRGDSLRTLIFVLLSAGTLWLFYNEKLKKWLFIVLMAGLVTADMVPVNLRYLGHDRFRPGDQNTPRPTAIDQQILADPEPGFRVMNRTLSTFDDATTSYFHRSVGGYHGAKLQRYQDVITKYLLYPVNMEVVNMLNTKYVIAPNADGEAELQVNPDANGAAWFVENVVTASGPDDEINYLGEINTYETAVVDNRFASSLEGVFFTNGDMTEEELDEIYDDDIEMTEYRVNLHRYEYTAGRPRMAVFSEIYYPKGWTAYIDGTEAPYFRADYILEAMALPPGEHTVEFRFRAPGYETLTSITWVCSILLLAGAATAITLTAVRRKKH